MAMTALLFTGCAVQDKSEKEDSISVYLWSAALYDTYAPYIQSQHPAVQKVITVHKAEIRSLCPFESCVACCREAPVFLVDCRYTFFLCGIFVTDRSAGIGGTIVHQQDLKIPVGLVQDAVHTPPEIGFHIVDRDNDTDQLCFHVLFPQKNVSLPMWRISEVYGQMALLP